MAKQKRIAPIEHTFGDSWIKVSGDPKYGIATIWDNDVLLFAISQLMYNLNHGMDVGRTIGFTGYEFFQFTGKKKKSGKGYSDLWASLERLHHTYVETNIRQGNKSRHHSFVWLSDIKQTHDGTRHTGYQIPISDTHLLGYTVEGFHQMIARQVNAVANLRGTTAVLSDCV